MIIPEQIKNIHTILPDMYKRCKEEKGDLVAQFTKDDKKRSTKDLTFEQANDLIAFLGGKTYVQDSYYGQFDIDNRQHRFILSLCHQIGWTHYHETLKKHVPDLTRLGAWMRTSSKLKKSLKSHTPKELTILVAQFEKMAENYGKQ